MRYQSSCSAGVTKPSRHRRAPGPCADSYCLLLQHGRATVLCSTTPACYLSSSPDSQQREGKKSPAIMYSSIAETCSHQTQILLGQKEQDLMRLVPALRGATCVLCPVALRRSTSSDTQRPPRRPSAVSREEKPHLLFSHLQHLLCVSHLTEPALEAVCFHDHTESTWQLIS